MRFSGQAEDDRCANNLPVSAALKVTQGHVRNTFANWSQPRGSAFFKDALTRGTALNHCDKIFQLIKIQATWDINAAWIGQQLGLAAANKSFAMRGSHGGVDDDMYFLVC